MRAQKSREWFQSRGLQLPKEETAHGSLTKPHQDARAFKPSIGWGGVSTWMDTAELSIKDDTARLDPSQEKIAQLTIVSQEPVTVCSLVVDQQERLLSWCQSSLKNGLERGA